MKTLSKKMWDIKLSLKKIKKATKGFKFQYTNLPDVEKNLRPLLVEHKIGYRFRLTHQDEGNILILQIFNEEGTEESEAHSLLIPKGAVLAGMNEYQALGSGITYFRRYLLVTAFGIITDDDADSVVKDAPAAVPVNYTDKIKQLIILGRNKAQLDRYVAQYTNNMSTDQRNEIATLIKDIK